MIHKINSPKIPCQGEAAEILVTEKADALAATEATVEQLQQDQP